MKTGKQKVIGEINITPLTDVFLVLLIIMIVVNPLLQTTGVSTSLADESKETKQEVKEDGPGDKKEEPKAITVSIDSAGAYSIGGEILDNELIKQRILALKDANPDGILLNVDPIAPLQRMTDIMDFARSADIQKISLSKSAKVAEAPAKP